MTQPSAMVLDEITRIYKNSVGRVIGIHCIHVHETRELNPNGIPGMNVSRSRFKRGAKTTTSFERFNLVMGESRVIDKIQMIGQYDDFVYVAGNQDISYVRYIGNEETNDVTVSFTDFPTIGETI
jgi:hypothetical protein